MWESLSTRYNFLSETHVQELRDQLYNLSKIEAYIDNIQDLAKKLVAAGSPVDDDELVFRALQGLPTVFNGLRTTVRVVRTRGHNVCFAELVTMMKGEEKQLSKATSEVDVHSTVLVASHSNLSQSHTPSGSSATPTPVTQPHVDTSQSLGVGYNQFASFPQSTPQPQYFPSNFRNFNRGRGTRGPQFPRNSCEICGRSNHSTNYCYYRPPNMPFDMSGSSWRGFASSSQSYPWMSSTNPGFHPVNTPVYQNFPQGPRPVSQFSGFSRSGGGFRPAPPMVPMQTSVQSSFPAPPMSQVHS